MVDKIEISNVSGFRGVASETTLLALIDAVKSQGGPNVSQTQKRIQDNYNKSILESTGSLSSFKDAVVATGKVIKEFSKEVVYGGDRLSDFANSIFGSTSVLTKFINYIDSTIDIFRNLASVGASFNNSIFDIIVSSGEAAMTLDSFVNMVRQNSQTLSSFGGTVTQGAQTFARLSREFRLGIGSRFLEMGLTIDSVNEGLLSYIQLETMRGRRNLLRDANLQQSASNYVLQLEKLTKITGQQRDALMDTQAALQTDARVRNAINKAQIEGGDIAAENARAIFTLTKTTLPSFHEALVDLSDGVAQSPLAQVLESQISGISAFMNTAARGSITQEQFIRTLQERFGPQLISFANNLDGATLDALRSAGGYYSALADAADNVYEFSNIMNYNAEEAAREANRRNAITSTLGKFEQGIIALRKFIFDRFINSAFAKRLGEFGQNLIDQFSENGTLSNAANTFNNFFDRVFGQGGYAIRIFDTIVNWINSPSFTNALDTVTTLIENMISALDRFITDSLNPNIGFWRALRNRFNGILSYLFGTTTSVEEGGRPETSQSPIGDFFTSLYENITDLFARILQWAGFPESINEEDTIYNRFMRWFGFENDGEPSTPLLERLANSLNGFLETLFRGSAFMSLFSRISESIELGILRALSHLTFANQGFLTDEGLARITELEGRSVPQLNEGTNGFQDFGPKGRLAMLHNSEAVVPRNSPAGEILDKFFNSQNKSVNYSSRTNDQSDIKSSINQLNNTMEKVIVLLNEGNVIQSKTMKNTRMLSGDLFRGGI